MNSSPTLRLFDAEASAEAIAAAEVYRRLVALLSEAAELVAGLSQHNGPAAIAAPAAPLPGLTAVERNLLVVADGQPRNSKVLARLAGYSRSSYVRAAITSLCRQGLLLRTPDGLRLATNNAAGQEGNSQASG